MRSAILLLALGMGGAALAAPNAAFDPQLLEPVDNSDGLNATKSAEQGRFFQPSFSFQLQYLRDPLVRVDADGKLLQRVIRNQFRLDVTAAIWVLPFWELGASFSGVPYQDGSYFETAVDIQKTAFADTRLFMKIALLPKNPTGLSLALFPVVTLPTGDRRNYLGEAWPTFVPQALVSWRFWGFFLGANLGVRFRRPTLIGDSAVSQELLWRIGAAWKLPLGPLALEPFVESYGAVGFDSIDPRRLLTVRNKPAELDAGTRIHILDTWTFGLAAGTGIVGGYGSPNVRVLGTIQFTIPEPPPTPRAPPPAPPPRQMPPPQVPVSVPGPADGDGDGIVDTRDRCPRDAEDADDFEDLDGCPEADNDKDSVPDATDACPLLAGIAARAGCPIADRDGDGVEDPEDRCEKESGPVANKGCPVDDRDGDSVPDQTDDCGGVAGVAEAKGCPPDTDGDGIVDPLDRCPALPGPASNDGCPVTEKRATILSRERIEILQRIDFKKNSAVLLPEGARVLDEVAWVLRQNPQLEKIRVEGHTSSEGSREYNLELSLDRAKAVTQYLVDKHGMDPSRLEPVGYGLDVPLVPNTTQKNRAKNRRVEFTIVDTDQPAVPPPPPPPPPPPGNLR